MLIKHLSLLAVLVFSFFFTGEARAMAQSVENDGSIYYTCHSANWPTAQNTLCTAVAEYLEQKGHHAAPLSGEIQDGLLLEFFLDDLQDHSISGRLVWSQCNSGTCGAKTESPRLDTTVMDAVVSPRSYGNLVKSLFLVTKPPMK